MPDRIDTHIVDVFLFITANVVNLLMTGIFLSRAGGLGRIEYVLGIVLVSLAIPVSGVVLFNIVEKRELWSVILPMLFIVYCIVELLLDYVLKTDFRNTALFYPYITVFYLSMMGLIGYSFLFGRIFGFITLSTYFLQMFAAWYSYTRVGHG